VVRGVKAIVTVVVGTPSAEQGIIEEGNVSSIVDQEAVKCRPGA
jgi:hypothetical protein